jgi:hypothetical protein
MKSDQNAGTGATAYGIGSLTANNMSLVNGPTWGAGGLAFVAASSQYGSIADFLGSETITVFSRITQTTATPGTAQAVFAQDNGGGTRGRYLNQQATAGNKYRLLRSSDGTANAGKFEVYDSDSSIATTTDTTLVCQWTAGGGRALWSNKTSRALTLAVGAAQTTSANIAEDVLFMAQKTSGSASLFMGGTATAFATITGDLTTTQRETLTDLINAL